jgi:hypothetical protein
LLAEFEELRLLHIEDRDRLAGRIGGHG